MHEKGRQGGANGLLNNVQEVFLAPFFSSDLGRLLMLFLASSAFSISLVVAATAAAADAEAAADAGLSPVTVVESMGGSSSSSSRQTLNRSERGLHAAPSCMRACSRSLTYTCCGCHSAYAWRKVMKVARSLEESERNETVKCRDGNQGCQMDDKTLYSRIVYDREWHF